MAEQSWSTPADIRDAVQKKWDSGSILQALTLDEADGLFPLRLKLKGPSSAQAAREFPRVHDWIVALQDGSRDALGYGYGLEFATRQLGALGRNELPTHAIVATADDALALLRRSKDARHWLAFCESLLSAFPAVATNMRPWLAKRGCQLLDFANSEGMVQRIIAVLNWFAANPASGLYLRQLDIPGVDTKFIERHRRLLGDLLDIVLERDAGNVDDAGVYPQGKKDGLERRFGLRERPGRVRVRFLDEAAARASGVWPLLDIQSPVEQLAALDPAVDTVVVCENEINGLALPPLEGALAIFGLGYAVELLAGLSWLAGKRVLYWGDIDTHGFAILNRARSLLPQVESVLMDEQTFLAGQELWVSELKPCSGELQHLDADEAALYNALRHNVYGTNLRLEQERIPYSRVVKAILGQCVR